MDRIEDELLQMDSFDRFDNNFENYSPKKVKENVREDIPVTFDSSSYKKLTDDNTSDYDNPGLYILCYSRDLALKFLISCSDS